MKRLVSLAAVGLMCGAAVLATTGVAGASSITSKPAATRTVLPGGAMIHVPGYTGITTVSENWSGYGVLSKRPFNYVHSTWVQPAIKCASGTPHLMASNWVGLDGFADQTVEQDGTSAGCGGPGHTTAIYKAWIEMYPAPTKNVFTVNAGDIMDATVNYSNGTFALTIADQTRGITKTVSAACSNCTRTSAEWIIERPAGCNPFPTNCFLFALPNFGSTTMSGATASHDGGAVENIGRFNPNPIDMIQPLKKGFITLDTVGPLNGASFTTTFDRSGTIVPIQLGPNR